MKIAILGYSECGKSTLAAYLSTYYHIPLLYLDTVQFEADWVIDGNYALFLQSRRLKEADYIIYMAFFQDGAACSGPSTDTTGIKTRSGKVWQTDVLKK